MSSFCCDPSRYLPHRTPMLLIDRVLAADAETTRCRVTVGEQCSLFRQADGSYPNSLFIEFMAQTVGVFAGIRDSESGIGPRVGFLLGSRKVQLHKKTLATELASRSITVNAVAPGLIETEMVTEEVLEHAMQLIPMRRIGKPEEVAGVVSFLMSEAASYVTRQVIGVNGGLA